MKYIYTIGIILLLFISSSQLLGQSLIVRAGTTYSTIDFRTDNFVTTELNTKRGYFIGAYGEFHLSETFKFETGFLYTKKGFIEKDSWTANVSGQPTKIHYKAESKQSYLEIPILFKANRSINKINVFTIAGPVISIGIGGELIQGLDNSEEITSSIKWGRDDDDNYHKLDLGFKAGTGMEIKRFQLAVFYNWGIVNILSSGDDEHKIFNRALYVSIGRRFFGK